MSLGAALRETARAKINLTLRVVGLRVDGYHDLESLVAFADLADVLTLEPGDSTTLDVTGPFAGDCGARDDNLVLKAVRAIGLLAGRFVLDKRIPVAAGLGGGSADAAAALRLIARANNLAAEDTRLTDAAIQCGADVPVCLQSHARLMRGRGDELSPPLTLPNLHAVLVNPGIPLATTDVFGAFKQGGGSTGKPAGEIPCDLEPLLAWLAGRGNDLTDAAILRVPVIGEILGEIAMQAGCRLARMSGSGATCVGLFDQPAAAQDAAQRLSAGHRNWWISPVTLG